MVLTERSFGYNSFIFLEYLCTELLFIYFKSKIYLISLCKYFAFEEWYKVFFVTNQQLYCAAVDFTDICIYLIFQQRISGRLYIAFHNYFFEKEKRKNVALLYLHERCSR